MTAPNPTTPASGGAQAGDLLHLESEARRFASMYPQHSDGHNTFVMFADKIAALSASRDQVRREGVEEAGRFLLDRLVDHEVRMTSEEDSREWSGHVTPAMARFRSALATSPHGDGR